MTRVLLGYYVRCTWVGECRGKTICSYAHKLYPTREEADAERPGNYARYVYDVAEVWTEIPE